MKKYLLKTFFRIIGYSVLLTFIFTLIIQIFIVEHGEKMRNCYMPLFTEIIFSGFSLFISLASITIFLTFFKKIIHNDIFSLLSFVLLPLIASYIILLFLADEEGNYILLFICALLFPVWVLIIWEYYKFNKIKKNFEK